MDKSVSFGVIGVLVPLLLSYIIASRRTEAEVDHKTGGGLVRYGFIVRVIGVGGALFALGLAIAYLFGKHSGSTRDLRLMQFGVVGMLLVGLPFAVEVHRRQLVFDRTGVISRTWFGERRHSWPMLVSVELSATGQDLVLAFRGGKTVKLPTMYMNGLGALRAAIEQHAPHVANGEGFAALRAKRW